MERFIARENLRRYRARLGAETNPAVRETLSKLIAEEEAKLEAAERDAQKQRAGQKFPSSKLNAGS